MARYERGIVYPPIRESTDQFGTVYTVDLTHGPVHIRFLDLLSREEAHFHVKESLRQGLREGRYYPSDFYPQGRYYYDFYPHDANDILLSEADDVDGYEQEEEEEEEEEAYGHDANDILLSEADDVDGYGQEEEEEEEEEASYGQQCFGGVPASDEAIVSLPETSVKEGDCSVCLEKFEAGNDKIRRMPCSHSFHEQCIFEWLSVSHVCPLCRFSLPTEEEEA